MRGHASIQPQEALVRSGDKAWLAVSVPIHLKRCSMGLRSGLCADQSSSSTHRPRQTISVLTSLCARGHSHAETGKGLPHTVATKLEAQNCLEQRYSPLTLRGPEIAGSVPPDN